MADEFDLMKELAAAAEPCFGTADRVAVYCEMKSRCTIARGRRPHLRGGPRRSPDTGRADRWTQGMARRGSNRRRRLPPRIGGTRRPCPNQVTVSVDAAFRETYRWMLAVRQHELPDVTGPARCNRSRQRTAAGFGGGANGTPAAWGWGTHSS